MNRKIWALVVAIITFLLALGLTLYPIISSRYNERHQSTICADYKAQVGQADTAAIDQARERAKQYNAALKPGVQQVGAFSHAAMELAAQDYAGLLNITGSGIMGYVEIPAIAVTLPIYHGTADATLETGVGHLLGTSLPIGGAGTHTVLTGHSGMVSQKMFTDLNQLAVGDVFYLNVLGTRLAYQVDQIKTVLPYDITYLGITEGEDYCTLITCTPYGINTHRLLVRGSRIPYEETEELTEEILRKKPRKSTWEQEYLKGVCLALGIVALTGTIGLALWLYRRPHHM